MNLELIADAELIANVTALDYEIEGGPDQGTLAEWRQGIAIDAEKQRAFIARVLDLNDDADAASQLSGDQRIDVMRFSVAALLAD